MKDSSNKGKRANHFQESMEAFQMQQKHRDKLLLVYLELSQENSEAGIDDGPLEAAVATHSPKKA